MYRFWHGPVVGMRVSQVWMGYASVSFLNSEG